MSNLTPNIFLYKFNFVYFVGFGMANVSIPSETKPGAWCFTNPGFRLVVTESRSESRSFSTARSNSFFACKPHINHKYSLFVITVFIFISKLLYFGCWERSWLDLCYRSDHMETKFKLKSFKTCTPHNILSFQIHSARKTIFCKSDFWHCQPQCICLYLTFGSEK